MKEVTELIIIAGMLLLGMQAVMVRAEEAAAPKPPDLTAGTNRGLSEWVYPGANGKLVYFRGSLSLGAVGRSGIVSIA